MYDLLIFICFLQNRFINLFFLDHNFYKTHCQIKQPMHLASKSQTEYFFAQSIYTFTGLAFVHVTVVGGKSQILY